VNKNDLRHYESLLKKERKQVIQEIENIEQKIKIDSPEGNVDANPYPYHWADIASQEENKEVDSQILSQMSRKLEMIDNALEKISRETYGKCEICGKFVEKERLEIIPYARYCKKCRAKLDAQSR